MQRLASAFIILDHVLKFRLLSTFTFKKLNVTSWMFFVFFSSFVLFNVLFNVLSLCMIGPVCHFQFDHLDRGERAGCFAFHCFVLYVS